MGQDTEARGIDYISRWVTPDIHHPCCPFCESLRLHEQLQKSAQRSSFSKLPNGSANPLDVGEMSEVERRAVRERDEALADFRRLLAERISEISHVSVAFTGIVAERSVYAMKLLNYLSAGDREFYSRYGAILFDEGIAITPDGTYDRIGGSNSNVNTIRPPEYPAEQPSHDYNGPKRDGKAIQDEVHERFHKSIGDVLGGRVIPEARRAMQEALKQAPKEKVPFPVKAVGVDPRRMGLA